MAPGKVATDFNAIINADRRRRKNEALAEEIFSKGRRQSAPGAGVNNRKPGTGPSLASRIGIAKRTVSTTQKNAAARSNFKPAAKPATGNVDADWTHDLHGLNNRSASNAGQAPRAPKPRVTRTERLYSALNGSASSPALNTQFNVIGGAAKGKGISIKGLAGPYTVMAKNFAQGTTADDIESAMTPIGGVCLSCRIINERPKVIAEITFESKEGADNVVSTFNNQNADGNLLHVFHKVVSPTPSTSAAPVSKPPVGPRADTITNRSHDTRSSDHYTPRNDRRRDYDSRDEVVDGSYGFDERMDTDDNYDSGRGLYSDDMVGRGRDRVRGNDRGLGNR